MTNLTGMAAIVMGASSGIGGGIARMLAARREAELVRFLLKQGGNVKMGPEIPIRTMRNRVAPRKIGDL